MRGVSQVLLQRCISRGSETYKTGGMGLTKTFKEFLFLHQSAYAKKPCKNNSTFLSGFTDKEAIFALKHSLLLRHVMSALVAWQGWFYHY